MSAAQRLKLSRALFLGAILSCVGGALMLLVRAAMLARVDCDGLTTAECVSAHQTGTELSRLHGGAALGLFLIGAGLLLFARSRDKEN